MRKPKVYVLSSDDLLWKKVLELCGLCAPGGTPNTTAAIQAFLAASPGCRAAQFASADELLARLGPRTRGCVIIDLADGAPSGLALLAELPRRRLGLPPIAVTARHDVATAVAAARAGAVAVLDRPLVDEQLARAISGALAVPGANPASPKTRLDFASRMAGLPAHYRQVIEMVAAGCGNRAIAARLDCGVRTVQRWRASTMHTLGAQSVTELVSLMHTARQQPPDWPTKPAPRPKELKA